MDISKLIADMIENGSSKGAILNASCSGGGGGTTGVLPGCSDSEKDATK